ncbi:unnamed protein product [Gadus morhua 'NCC']
MAGVTSSFILLIFVWLISCVSLKLKLNKWIYLVDYSTNWDESRRYCQSRYTDLISFLPEDQRALGSLGIFIKAWVGLKRDPAHSRPWSWMETSYNEDGIDIDCEDCAILTTEKVGETCMRTEFCSRRMNFYCSSNNVFHIERVPWEKANDLCQHGNEELSTVNSANIKDFKINGWVGLHRDVDGTWGWTGEPSDSYEWLPEHPPPSSDCGLYDERTDGLLADRCDEAYPFVCYDEPLTTVRENKTWEEALQHCRDLDNNYFKYDLLSSAYDHRYANLHVQQAVTTEVWIGLRFLAGEWKWIDGEEMEYQGLPHCAPQWKHCGTRNKKNNNLELRDCMEKRNFICSKTRIGVATSYYNYTYARA